MLGHCGRQAWGPVICRVTIGIDGELTTVRQDARARCFTIPLAVSPQHTAMLK